MDPLRIGGSIFALGMMGFAAQQMNMIDLMMTSSAASYESGDDWGSGEPMQIDARTPEGQRKIFEEVRRSQEDAADAIADMEVSNAGEYSVD